MERSLPGQIGSILKDGLVMDMQYRYNALVCPQRVPQSLCLEWVCIGKVFQDGFNQVQRYQNSRELLWRSWSPWLPEFCRKDKAMETMADDSLCDWARFGWTSSNSWSAHSWARAKLPQHVVKKLIIRKLNSLQVRNCHLKVVSNWGIPRNGNSHRENHNQAFWGFNVWDKPIEIT